MKQKHESKEIDHKEIVTKSAISNFPFASVSKQVLKQNFSCENKFNLHESELTDETILQQFCKKTRFDSEAKGNLEVARLLYCIMFRATAFCKKILDGLSCTY